MNYVQWYVCMYVRHTTILNVFVIYFCKSANDNGHVHELDGEFQFMEWVNIGIDDNPTLHSNQINLT